jgi:hypothetical protein
MPTQVSNVIGDSLKRKSERRRMSHLSGMNFNPEASVETLEDAAKNLNSSITLK